MIPKLKEVALDGGTVDRTGQYLKEFPTSVYISLYAKWEAASDSKERIVTLLLWKATTLFLTLWEGDEPYMRKFAQDWYYKRDNSVVQVLANADDVVAEVEYKVLPKDLPELFRSIPADDFVKMVDDFADSLPKPWLDATALIMDTHLAPLSDTKKLAEKND